jgi:predicted transcriptional regulator of viral defense system
MTYERILKKITKPFFTLDELAFALDLRPDSAAVLCNRYVKKGLLTRLKRGLYARTETLSNLGQVELFQIANLLQVPSYISLTTAISYYGMTTQVQRNFFESICIKRTKTFDRGGLTFQYIKINPRLYGGFKKDNGVFIALPEKAILDSFYLASMGRYPLDVSSLDLTKLDEHVLAELSSIYPSKAIKHFERHYEEIRRT